MHIDVSTFLAGLTESRRAHQVAERKGFIPASGIVLPVALEVALRHRLLLTPVLARSRLATTSASIGVPSCERAQIEYWFSRFGEDANWQLHLGQSGIVALAIDPAQAKCSLAALTEDDDAWNLPGPHTAPLARRIGHPLRCRLSQGQPAWQALPPRTPQGLRRLDREAGCQPRQSESGASGRPLAARRMRHPGRDERSQRARHHAPDRPQIGRDARPIHPDRGDLYPQRRRRAGYLTSEKKGFSGIGRSSNNSDSFSRARYLGYQVLAPEFRNG
jgi:hypothetical protein